MSRTELRGEFGRVRHKFDARDPAEPPSLVCDLASGETVRLTAFPQDLIAGCVYRFWGQWKRHPKYGEQFAAETHVIESPSGRTAIVEYLKTLPGIGTTTAGRLWDAYGESAIDFLRDSPERVAAEIKGLTAEKAAIAADYIARDSKATKARIDLLGMLHGRGIPKKTIDKILRDYGAAAAETIRKNAYLLMRYKGCSFGRCDRLYLESGGNPARLKRQALCCWHAVASQSTGDTWFPVSVARRAIAEGISGADLRTEAALRLIIRSKGLDERQDMGATWVAESRKSESEQRLAELIVEAEQEN